MPNVFECIVFIVVVARAERVPARAVAGMVARTILFVVALRALVVGFATRAVVAVREFVRAVVAVRETVFLVVLRAVMFFVVVSRTVVFFVVSRDMEFASRTAASAIPTPIKSAVMRYITFLILWYKYMLSKMQACSNKKMPRLGHFLICIFSCRAIAFNKCYAPLVQVVWCHFNANAFADVNPDACLAHFAADGCQNFMSVFQFYTEHSVGQFVFDSATENHYIVFCHEFNP